MAPVATGAEVTVVDIVAPVAIQTAPGAAAEALQRPVVTTAAVNCAVRIAQREARVIVIEAPDQPGVRVVALRAVRAQAALMDIVVTMTVEAA